MQLWINGKDVTNLIETINWSGDEKQVSRKISFTALYQKNNPQIKKLSVKLGDVVQLKSSQKIYFLGIVFTVEKSAKSEMRTYEAKDFLMYICNSDIYRKFNGTPASITKKVASELGVDVGTLANPDITVKMSCLGKSGYQVIMMAYTKAKKRTKKKYMMIMKKDKLHVIEKGKSSKVKLDITDIDDATFKTTLENMVNKVIVVNKKKKKVATVQDTSLQKKYGVIQKVYSKEDGKHWKTEANNMIVGREESATVNAIDDPRAMAGYSLYVREPNTGLYGKFFIASDSHSYSNGTATMSLTLEFENVMDEVEIEKES